MTIRLPTEYCSVCICLSLYVRVVFVCILCVSMLTITPRGEQVLRRCCASSKTWQIICCGSKRFAQSRVHKNILHTSFSFLLSRSLSLSRCAFTVFVCIQILPSECAQILQDRPTNQPTDEQPFDGFGSDRTRYPVQPRRATGRADFVCSVCMFYKVRPRGAI